MKDFLHSSFLHPPPHKWYGPLFNPTESLNGKAIKHVKTTETTELLARGFTFVLNGDVERLDVQLFRSCFLLLNYSSVITCECYRRAVVLNEFGLTILNVSRRYG